MTLNLNCLNQRINMKLSRYISVALGHLRKDWIIFMFIFAAGICFTAKINIREGHVRQKVWSDAAHYYVYMPATFIYGWDVFRFPYKIEKKFEGFLLDTKTGKVVIKTTYGEALLLLPFFLAAHSSAYVFGIPMDGFSAFYQVFMLVGCVFYFTLALFFIKKFLAYYYSHAVSLITVVLIALTTQMLFYAYDAILMSHVYSFFIFSSFIYLLKKYYEGGRRSYLLFTLISMSLALAVLLRPTNIMIVLWMPFLDLKSAKELWQRILFFLNPKRSLVYILIQFLVLIPQFIYWKYLSGHYLYYSYPGEVFYWAHPMLLQIWFSPLNGLFPYHPAWFIFIAGMFFMISRKKLNGWFTILFFLLSSYVFSCWHCWFYGGSYGFRPLAEFAVFMALPLGMFIQTISRMKNLFIKSSVLVLFVSLIYYNLMQLYHYNVFTGGMWSWDDFTIKLKNYKLLDCNQKTYLWESDFSNYYDYEPVLLLDNHSRSRVSATYCNYELPDNVHYKKILSGILDHPVRKVSMSVYIYPSDADSTHASWIATIEQNGKTLLYKEIPFDKFTRGKNIYSRIESTLEIPGWIDQNSLIHFFISNPKRREFFIDDMSLEFE